MDTQLLAEHSAESVVLGGNYSTSHLWAEPGVGKNTVFTAFPRWAQHLCSVKTWTLTGHCVSSHTYGNSLLNGDISVFLCTGAGGSKAERYKMNRKLLREEMGLRKRPWENGQGIRMGDVPALLGAWHTQLYQQHFKNLTTWEILHHVFLMVTVSVLNLISRSVEQTQAQTLHPRTRRMGEVTVLFRIRHNPKRPRPTLIGTSGAEALKARLETHRKS